MEIEHELGRIAPEKETFLTIGVFDGVHVGHRYLLGKLQQVARSKAATSAVVTFTPHPQSVLHPSNPLPCLTDLQDRVERLRELGIDVVVVLSFTPQLAQLRAEEFMSLLKKHLKMRGIIVGPDFALGRNREGNVDLLRSLGEKMDFVVEVISPFTLNGEVVSSTLIRQALALGRVDKVKALMGRYFSLEGKVITSDKRGRALGFPTANLEAKPSLALPGHGIYATFTHVNGKKFLSATNIGVRPTFGEGKKLIETHLMDYSGDLYRKEIKVEFVKKLRDEQKFASIADLKTQIERDIREARAILARELDGEH
jgi:riboflavin kinase/FMN adenylyltransferase